MTRGDAPPPPPQSKPLPHPINAGHARLWLLGAGGEGPACPPLLAAPWVWAQAVNRGVRLSVPGGGAANLSNWPSRHSPASPGAEGHAGLGRGSPGLELRHPLRHTPLPPPSRAWPQGPHTMHTGPVRDGGWPAAWGGAEECGPPHPLAGSPEVLRLGSAPHPPRPSCPYALA